MASQGRGKRSLRRTGSVSYRVPRVSASPSLRNHRRLYTLFLEHFGTTAFGENKTTVHSLDRVSKSCGFVAPNQTLLKTLILLGSQLFPSPVLSMHSNST